MNEVPDEKFVAFLDILGFKDIVTQNDHYNLQNLYSTFEKYIVEDSISLFGSKADTTLVSGNIISDSIILWTEDTSTMSFLQLVLIAQRLVIAGFMAGMPVRGGIAKGSVTVKKTFLAKTIFGLGLVNAYTLETMQVWSGCVIQDGIVEHLLSTDYEFNKLIREVPVIEYYPVPWKKKDEQKDRWCINWPIKLVRTSVEITSIFAAHKKDILDARTQIKIQNTNAFNEAMVSKYEHIRKYIMGSTSTIEADRKLFIEALSELGFTNPPYDTDSSFRQTQAADFISKVKEKIEELKTSDKEKFQSFSERILKSDMHLVEAKWLVDLFMHVQPIKRS